MQYHFDEEGWYSTAEIEGRSTEVPIPNKPLQEGYGWNFTGYVWFQQKLIPDVVVSPAIQKITKLKEIAFLKRLTDDEAIAIDLASIGSTKKAATLRRFQSKLDASSVIDLADQWVIDGIRFYETNELIAVGRADEILNTPVSAEEQP